MQLQTCVETNAAMVAGLAAKPLVDNEGFGHEATQP
jgi:hypothetical protein